MSDGKSAIFECVACDQYYCAECDDGAEDACPQCMSGPRCNACAVDHQREHEAEAEEAAEDGDEGDGGPPYDAATRTGMYDHD